MKHNSIPALRVRALNTAPINIEGDYVLYWMIANRRLNWNFSLQRAVAWAQELQKPLLIFEALRLNYRWASDRLHRFVLQGMAENLHICRQLPVTYYCYVEPQPKDGQGLFESLASKACTVVTDDFPSFFLPSMLKLVSRLSPVQLEAVDSNGLLPMRATNHVFPTAYAFRRYLQKALPEHLDQFPAADPLKGVSLPKLLKMPAKILQRWPVPTAELLQATPAALAALNIDHQVRPAAMDGGSQAAQRSLKNFLQSKLSRYADDRNHCDDGAASGLSPYLHFGHVSAHDVFSQLAHREGWKTDQLSPGGNGSRSGWWGMSDNAESFLDELITWRELGYNMCAHLAGYDQYESLPGWAQKTLADHAADPRPFLYTLEEFETSQTHDEIWNAAQRELVADGRMHNYLRMLWGKKILEWSPTPQQALATMIELNNKYAVDGRNPNSYSGIFWVLGRYDRAWGPERPIYGKIRYMTSDSTRRKLRLDNYLKRFGPAR